MNETSAKAALADMQFDEEDNVDRMRAAVGKLAEIREQDGELRNRLFDIPVTMQVIIGKVEIPVCELLSMKSGQVICLDREIGEPVELAVNGKVVAHAQIVVCEGETPKLGVSITTIRNPA